jgi:chromosome partitioning protein
MTRVIAVTNQKGGVGKTTTAVNLAASLAATGQSVLLVDLDPQGNATTGSGINKATLGASIYQLLLGQATLERAMARSEEGQYDVLPANRDLAGAEVELIDIPKREYLLKQYLERASSRYSYIIIDCPPALNLLTVNGLVAADAVMIPMQCEYYALEGLSDLVNTIRLVKKNLNPQLEIEGLLRTMYDPRNALTVQVSEQLEQHFGGKVYKTVIPRNVRLAEAPSYGKPVMYHDAGSKGAQAYRELASEMLERSTSPSSDLNTNDG